MPNILVRRDRSLGQRTVVDETTPRQLPTSRQMDLDEANQRANDYLLYELFRDYALLRYKFVPAKELDGRRSTPSRQIYHIEENSHAPYDIRDRLYRDYGIYATVIDGDRKGQVRLKFSNSQFNQLQAAVQGQRTKRDVDQTVKFFKKLPGVSKVELSGSPDSMLEVRGKITKDKKDYAIIVNTGNSSSIAINDENISTDDAKNQVAMAVQCAMTETELVRWERHAWKFTVTCESSNRKIILAFIKEAERLGCGVELENLSDDLKRDGEIEKAWQKAKANHLKINTKGGKDVKAPSMLNIFLGGISSSDYSHIAEVSAEPRSPRVPPAPPNSPRSSRASSNASESDVDDLLDQTPDALTESSVSSEGSRFSVTSVPESSVPLQGSGRPNVPPITIPPVAPQSAQSTDRSMNTPPTARREPPQTLEDASVLRSSRIGPQYLPLPPSPILSPRDLQMQAAHSAQSNPGSDVNSRRIPPNLISGVSSPSSQISGPPIEQSPNNFDPEIPDLPIGTLPEVERTEFGRRDNIFASPIVSPTRDSTSAPVQNTANQPTQTRSLWARVINLARLRTTPASDQIPPHVVNVPPTVINRGGNVIPASPVGSAASGASTHNSTPPLTDAGSESVEVDTNRPPSP